MKKKVVYFDKIVNERNKGKIVNERNKGENNLMDSHLLTLK